MSIRGLVFAGIGVTILAGASMAQTVGAAAPRGPVLQLKPAAAAPVQPWRPKVILRSQLRPILKPSSLGAESDADVYVPPAAPGSPKPKAAAVPAAQLAPVQLAAHTPPAAAGQPADPSPLQGTSGAASIRDFAGRYLGAGVEVALAPATDEPPRRMSQVEISGDAAGFTVKWATMKIGANFKPETVKSTQQELSFKPTGAPNQYRAVAAEAGQPAPDASAEVQGRTLVVTVTTPLPSGRPSVQRYERTLTDTGMTVVFTRSEDGAVVRQVNLTLTKSPSSVW